MNSSHIVLALCLAMVSFVFAKVVVNKGSKPEQNMQEVERKADGYEIRRYQASTVATVNLGTGDYNSLSSLGFRKLANYIFGGNARNEKIAMTSPVMMDLGESSAMHFFMPDGYSVSSLPRPNNDEVKLEELESKRVAVIQFGGWANQSKIDRYQAKLIQLLKEDGVAHTDNFYFLGYNAPYEVTNRRNEVIVELE